MLNLKTKLIAIDTETTGLNPWRPKDRWGIAPDRPFAFSFCDSHGNTDYVRWDVNPKTREVKPDKKSFREMSLIFKDKTITKVFHNVSFDHRMITKSGFTIRGKLHDTIFLSHVCTGGAERSYGLKPLGEKFLDIGQEDQDDLVKSVHKARRAGKKKGWALAQKETHGNKPVYADYWLGDKDLCEKYAVQDAVRTMLLFQMFQDELNDPTIKRVYQRELNLFWVTKRMEDVGCRVFPEDIDRLRDFYQNYMTKQMAKVRRHGGAGLNFNSHKQMHQKFYVDLGFKPKYNDNGGMTLDAKQLVKLSAKSPLAKSILEWKAGDHMLSAFLNPYDRFKVKEGKDTWVLHPKYKQCGPITGRFSCADPNLMNVASEKTGDRKADITLKPRECLGPRDGFIWYMPDWSQIEVWIFAFLSGDKIMKDALLAGENFHTVNATKAWGKMPDFKKNFGIYRKRAKALFFGRLYGGGKKAASEALGCTLSEAIEYIDQFESELPGIADFTLRTIEEVCEFGFVKNPFGRMYKLSMDNAYKGVNYKVQGTSADISKRAMIRLQRMLDKEAPGANLILMLHDEFAIEVPLKYDSYSLRKKVVKAMQKDSAKLGVPIKLPVGMSIAKSRWAAAIDLCDKHLKENCCGV